MVEFMVASFSVRNLKVCLAIQRLNIGLVNNT